MLFSTGRHSFGPFSWFCSVAYRFLVTMKLASWIILLLLVLDVLAKNAGLQLNRTSGITFIINKAAIVINPSQETKVIEPQPEEKLTGPTTHYMIIIVISAVLGYYIIPKCIGIADISTKENIRAASHVTFRMDGVTYVLLKCNDQGIAKGSLFYNTVAASIISETGEAYI